MGKPDYFAYPHSSVLENIRYGLGDADFDDVVRAAKLANAHSFIMNLKDGYDSIIGERGVKLSGGQKQRLAIARALIKKPKIIIFDEATSSLDSESENEIHNAIKKIQGNSTLIIVAHRFATIQSADKIIVFEDGKVIEEGTYSNLSKNGGLLSKLKELQKLGEMRDN